MSVHARASAKLIVSLALLAVWAAPSAAKDVLIVEEGKPAATIVVAEGASEKVTVAVHDLRAYIERISGAALPILSESQARAGTRIDVGPTRKAQAQLPEGFAGHEERVVAAATYVASRQDFGTPLAD